MLKLVAHNLCKLLAIHLEPVWQLLRWLLYFNNTPIFLLSSKTLVLSLNLLDPPFQVYLDGEVLVKVDAEISMQKVSS